MRILLVETITIVNSDKFCVHKCTGIGNAKKVIPHILILILIYPCTIVQPKGAWDTGYKNTELDM